ncbi:MAG: Ig-like domain-containing protein [Oscillospiraceae bacterium]|nr:Ig-like domain-containing protein [Oscillospiraceae bacterium]
MKQSMIKIMASILSVIIVAGMIGCQDSPLRVLHPDAEANSRLQATENILSEESDKQHLPILAEDRPLEVESIMVMLDAVRVARGAHVTPEVIILPYDAADKSFTLTSSDNNIIRRRSGHWSAVGEGTAQLIATAPNGVTGFATVIVYVAAEAIVVDADEIIIHRGEHAVIAPQVLPEDTTDKVMRFFSADETIAEISEDGTIYAVYEGSALISIYVGDITETMSVTVIEPVSAINVSTDRRLYLVGEQGRFHLRITPAGASDAALTVSVSGDEIVLTGENAFSAETPGDVTLTVTAANGISGSQLISVIDLEAFAQEVFRLTNAEREMAGLHQLTTSDPLTQTALVRAEEITEYFSHTRPDGRDCFTAFTENGVEYLTAGENLAAGHRTPYDVVYGWMRSPSHRENIVNAAFNNMGIGVVMDEDGRLYWAQAFTD